MNAQYEPSLKVDPLAIEALDAALEHHFASKLIVQPGLTRSLVSFQANKTKPVYRWYKYKEAFSSSLVEYLLQKYAIQSGKLLDPFAGSGTALFTASTLGLKAEGIEVLPIGQQIITIKKLLDSQFTPDDVAALRRWTHSENWKNSRQHIPLPELRITKGAYPADTQEAIEKFLAALNQENERVRAVLTFALLCVLEEVSYTRKDGQYLRWDYRSGRKQGKKPFNKGVIRGFEQAISEKLTEIIGDLTMPVQQLSFFDSKNTQGTLDLYNGSCLDVMPELSSGIYDTIITSPPYCNRYDYTRTYALELALLGVDQPALTHLRQLMLSCTVENRPKDLLGLNPNWAVAIEAAENQELLQAILNYLDDQKRAGVLNNAGIPRMIRGYFYEMACVIYECARVLRSNGLLFMVNDNVRYAGVSISVDLILSDFAEKLGFQVEEILVLPNGKGNSSQQMGEHGRKALRKCIYVWRKL